MTVGKIERVWIEGVRLSNFGASLDLTVERELEIVEQSWHDPKPYQEYRPGLMSWRARVSGGGRLDLLLRELFARRPSESPYRLRIAMPGRRVLGSALLVSASSDALEFVGTGALEQKKLAKRKRAAKRRANRARKAKR